MTSQRMNFVIATFLGWTVIFEEYGRVRGNPCGLESARTSIHDYCNDLNAMHGALFSINDRVAQAKFGDYLNQIINRDKKDEFRFLGATPFNMATATPRQLAEAFLLTVGKWEE